MKNLLKILLIIIPVIIAIPCFALVTAEQQILLNFPLLNTVEVSAQDTSGDINSDTGNLLKPLSAVFDISTNNESGAIADFSVLVDTTSGSVDGISNREKIVLTNMNSLPTQAAVFNALSPNPSKEQNPNVIAYEITLPEEQIINTPGNTQARILINNNGSFLGNTFSKTNDNAGTYQATIYCTVYSP